MIITALLLPLLLLPPGDAVTAPPVPVTPVPPAQLTSAGLVWSYNAGAGQVPVQLGDHGGQVLTFANQAGLALFSSFDTAGTPAPLWTTGNGYYYENILGTDETDTYLVSEFVIVGAASSQGLLKFFRSGSSGPVWTFDRYPVQFLSIPWPAQSRDGQTIVTALAREHLPLHEFRVHDAATGEVLKLFSTPVEDYSLRFALSPDGTTIAHSGSTGVGFTRVVDLATEALLFRTPGSLPFEQGISGDGRVIAVSEMIAEDDWHVRVFARQANDYVEVVDEPATSKPRMMVVSEDGSTVVAAWQESTTTVRVRAYDVRTGDTTMERTISGQGVQNLQNQVDGLDVSADGQRFALGLWGDGTTGVVELAVYASDSNTPLEKFSIGGSVLDLDMSADGRRVVVNRAPNHVNQGYPFTRVELYDMGGSDLTVHGVPSAGATVEVELLDGELGDQVVLLTSAALADDPAPLGPGQLFLDRELLGSFFFSHVGVSGVAEFELELPSDPTLVGKALFLQGLTLEPPVTPTADWVKLTLLH